MSGHPELICDDCGGCNIRSWFIDADVWNAVMHDGSGILCPSCFVVRHEAMTGNWGTWELSAPVEWVPLEETT